LWRKASSNPKLGKFEDILDLQHDNIRSVIVSGGFSASCGSKPAAVLSCKICDVYCDSLSQWKHHNVGRQHQVRLVGGGVPEKTKLTNSLKVQKTVNFFPRIT